MDFAQIFNKSKLLGVRLNGVNALSNLVCWKILIKYFQLTLGSEMLIMFSFFFHTTVTLLLLAPVSLVRRYLS